ncbi:MAG: TIGR04283 family arsenosugar biosynthesis glycosyltransferase [Dissulfuribacterales bacterium]
MNLSVIIPAFNEEIYIAKSIASALANSPLEVLVIDGGSGDHTVEISMAMGARVIKSQGRSRAIQMNLGARSARGDVFLFLHADTILPQHYTDAVFQAITSGKYWGFFDFGLDNLCIRFRLLELGVAFRSRILGLSYGDQGMFVTREFFERLGGFDETAAMEDLDFLLRARRISKPCLMRKKIMTSARRWEKDGFWRVTLQNQVKLIRFFLSER